MLSFKLNFPETERLVLRRNNSIKVLFKAQKIMFRFHTKDWINCQPAIEGMHSCDGRTEVIKRLDRNGMRISEKLFAVFDSWDKLISNDKLMIERSVN